MNPPPANEDPPLVPYLGHSDAYSIEGKEEILSTDAKAAGGKASVLSSGFNLANSAIGAGVLAFPYAFYQTGLLLGLLITVFQVFVCSFTLEWIGRASLYSEESLAGSYERIVKHLLGRKASIIVILCLLGNCLGAMVGFVIIIGDMTEPIAMQLFGDHLLTSRGFITLLFVILIILPISSLKNIDNLRITSLISLVCISLVVVLVAGKMVVALVQGTLPDPGGLRWVNISWEVFQAIPVITFALTCHAQAAPIYNELQKHSTERFRYVIAMTYGFCLVLYLMNGICGYILFQNNTQDNILKNFAQDDWVANAARLCVTFTVTFSYPLMNYAFREAVDFLLFNIGFQAVCGEVPLGVPPERDITKPSHLRFVIETVVAGILCWIVSVIIPSISVVFGLIGSLAGSSIVFIFPSLMQFKRSTSFTNRGSTIAVITLGALIAIVGTTTIVVGLVSPFP